VAIKTGNLRTIQTLLNAKASLEHVDNQANSVFHYAANMTKEIIVVNIMFCAWARREMCTKFW
jgi:calcium-independent phospholipase A2